MKTIIFGLSFLSVSKVIFLRPKLVDAVDLEAAFDE
jgi:hypothetical protein